MLFILGWECPQYPENYDCDRSQRITQMCSADAICNSIIIRRKCCRHPCYNFPICQLAVPDIEKIRRQPYSSYPLSSFIMTEENIAQSTTEQSQVAINEEEILFPIETINEESFVNCTEIVIDHR